MDNTTAVGLPEPQIGDYIEMAYLGLFILVGAPLNLAAFVKLFKRFKAIGCTRLLLLKIHLNITDMMVIFSYAIAEFCWLVTYDWRGGSVLCPVIMFMF